MKNKIVVRTQYDSTYNPDDYGLTLRLQYRRTTQPNQTAFAEECDINHLMKRYEQTGELPQATKELLYGDFSDVASFQEAQDIVLLGKAQFENLPARVRDRFNNDPARFLEFVTEEENRSEAEKLGILKPKPEPEAKAPETEQKPPSEAK